MVEPNQSLKFFVYIIESPSDPDIYHRRSEGDILAQTLKLQEMPCVVRTAISLKAFKAALDIGMREELNAHPGLIPILHISAHGSEEGIQLSNGEILLWEDLRKLLLPINAALNDCLLVCMSSCFGYSGCRMAMHLEDHKMPFFALIGNAGTPTWADTTVAYGSFYHLVAKGKKITEAVHAMQVAAGNIQFHLKIGIEARTGYIDYIKNLKPEDISALLEKSIKGNNDNHQQQLDNVKMLEAS